MGTTIPNNHATFSIEQVLEHTSGRLLQRGEASRVEGVGTDTRTIEPGQMFVALTGERFDGHDHVRAAFEAGATAALVSKRVEAPEAMTVIRVDETLQALGALGRAHARRWRERVRRLGRPGKLFAVTGSAGKTTTCRAVHAVLSACGAEDWTVHVPVGNLNNAIGVPMVLLGLTDEHGMGVIETGTSSPGEIAYSASLIEPEAAVVTLVAPAHTEELGDVEAVAREKTTLYERLGTDGVLVVNMDDIRVAQGAERHQGTRRAIRYGSAEGNDIQIVHGQLLDQHRQRVDLDVEGERVQVTIPILGNAGSYAAAAAIAACLAMCGNGCKLDEAVEALARMTPEQGRLRPKDGLNGALIVDDTYNANPASMEDSIRATAQLASQTGRALGLVLGDMLELGHDARRAHRELGHLAAAVGASWLVTVGPLAKITAEEAMAEGVPTQAVGTATEAGAVVREKLNDHTVVLMKGSRGVHLEDAVRETTARSGELVG